MRGGVEPCLNAFRLPSLFLTLLMGVPFLAAIRAG